MKENVENRLRMIEEEYHVRILLAVESGSRAWGFASKDSDFDVRFIYVRSTKDYLKLEKQRDVIELPVDAVWDINGWDLDKALRLMASGNPTLFEWLYSPIVYRTTKEADYLRTLAKQYFDGKKAAYHYYHLAKRVYTQMEGVKVKAKKYFNVLRCILACQWVLERNSIPPVRFTKLMDEMLNDHLKQSCNDLLEVKKQSAEGDVIERITCLDEFIEDKLLSLKTEIEQLTSSDKKGWELLNQCFLEIVNQSLS